MHSSKETTAMKLETFKYLGNKTETTQTLLHTKIGSVQFVYSLVTSKLKLLKLGYTKHNHSLTYLSLGHVSDQVDNTGTATEEKDHQGHAT